MQKLRLEWLVLAVVMVFMTAACTMQMLPTASSDTADEPAQEEGMAQEESMEAESSDPELATDVELLPAEAPPFNTANWTTDFSQRTVEYSEILSGGPPKDGIPSVDDPTFEPAVDATERLSEQEPVIVFTHEGEAKAYPLSILIWHEIVNDEVGGKPVSVTFCPLCNASIVFDREFDGQILDFGTTGRLRNSDLIMYDRQTETWWQQFTGEGLIGEYAGRQLTFLPSQVLSFADFVDRYEDGLVMETPDFRRQYGANPYGGYDTSARPFLFSGEIDERLAALERVVGIDLDGTIMAYSFSDASDEGAINDEVADMSLVVLHKDGTASALDSSIIENGRDVGSVGVYNRQVGDQTLTFVDNEDGTFSDEETGSTWLITGEAVDGELAGTQLERVLSFDHFWFAWSAFFPNTGLYGS
ncbi:MAG: DUF3179 domain-containing protein [Chloroflexota bacterium]